MLMPMVTATATLPSALSAGPASTPLVSPSATGLPRALASATLMLMPMVTATATLPSALSAVPASTPLVSPSATGLPRALASVTLMLTPTVTVTLQSWPRATQAGPELLPQDSSLPATDADWARGPLMPSPPLATATGPHRELTVWDSTAVDTTG